MLKLVYVNPNPTPAPPPTSLDVPNSNNPRPSKNLSSREAILANILPLFTAEVRFIDPSSYTMVAHDLSHYLSCALPLEIRTSCDESDFGDVICHFPIIQEKYLYALVWENEKLLSLVMVQFQLRILEQLLMFCANHNALKLIIYIDPLEATQVDVYKEFAIHTNQVLTHQGGRIVFTISTDLASHEKLLNFMGQISADINHALLQDHDPVVQQYLKFTSFVKSC